MMLMLASLVAPTEEFSLKNAVPSDSVQDLFSPRPADSEASQFSDGRMLQELSCDGTSSCDGWFGIGSCDSSCDHSLYSPPPPSPYPPLPPFEICETKVNVVLVLDNSGSMYGLEPSVRYFARSLVAQFRLEPGHSHISVIEFSTSELTRVLVGLTNDRHAVEAAIAQYDQSDGWTNIALGLEMAKDLLASPPSDGRKIIVLLSDGEQSEAYGFSEPAITVAQAARNAG